MRYQLLKSTGQKYETHLTKLCLTQTLKNTLRGRERLYSYKSNTNVSVRLKYSPHMFSMNKRQRTQVHHVPRRAVVVAHQVEGHSNVGMAVIKAQIVLQHNTKQSTLLFKPCCANLLIKS